MIGNCLVKDRERPWKSAHDVGLQLAAFDEESASAPRGLETMAPAARSARVTLGLGFALALTLGGLATTRWQRRLAERLLRAFLARIA